MTSIRIFLIMLTLALGPPVAAQAQAPQTPPAITVAAQPSVPATVPCPAAAQASAPVSAAPCDAYKKDPNTYAICQDRVKKIQRMLDARTQRETAAGPATTTPAKGTAASTPAKTDAAPIDATKGSASNSNNPATLRSK